MLAFLSTIGDNLSGDRRARKNMAQQHRRRSNGTTLTGNPFGDSDNASQSPVVINVRRGLGLSRKLFSRLSGFSERTIAGWESGDVALSESSRQRMKEL